ncbi:D-2-hydroxyacid dehydrogenase [Martelella mediterranea]|uniref:Glyoxylate/hydroxypyruvate reductase B n=1 Tax=Martelella mediterranea DSM 17316 TaxID=1122214 RepID=A0A1U9YWY6_9HYPH|nr:D-2-hydroxyacid dehydrogenase [Martelella mediterranea]AQZ49946.1 Glyoxylate/hydroxypyruvate reductase B [Martelella mediterranea DSM 17316]
MIDTPPEVRIEEVLFTLALPEDARREVEAVLAPTRIIFATPDDDATIRKALETVDVAVVQSDIDERFLAGPKLKWVHCGHSGLTKSAMPGVFEKGIVVTGSAGRSAEALAQHAFYFALALTFDARRLIECQAAHIWRGIPGYDERLGLAGKTLGIVGLGHTGAAMAALGKAFQMNVIAYTRSARADTPPNVDRLICADAGGSLDTLIEDADVIMLATQLNDETHHLFSAREFALMRPSAFIINMARGPVIDEEALTAALRSGAIAGAGLDVFDREPLPPDAPIWDAPNVLITPHMTPALPDRARRVIEILLENIRRYRAGEPMLNQLTSRDVYSKRV